MYWTKITQWIKNPLTIPEYPLRLEIICEHVNAGAKSLSTSRMQVSKCPYLALAEHFSIKRPIFRERHFWNSNADRKAVASAKPFVAIQILDYASSSADLLHWINIVSDPRVYGLNEVIVKRQASTPLREYPAVEQDFIPPCIKLTFID